MNQQPFFQPQQRTALRSHLIAVLGLFVLAVIYFSPVLSGKMLNMPDVQQASASAREIRELAKQTGEKPQWTDAVFSGMPSYMIDYRYPYILVYKAVMGVIDLLPNTASIVFVMLLSMYVLLVVLGCNPWLSVLGAVAYGFGTFSMVSLEAGHVSKLFALGYGAGLLAGVVLALRGRYWVGAALTGFFTCMEFGANHIQITYYLFMTVGLYILFESVSLIRAGKGRQLALGLATLVMAGMLGAGSFAKRVLVLNQYTKETIRGKSELTAKTTNPDGKAPASESKGGLDKDYAFTYSYGKAETLTLLVPNAAGGASSGGGLTTNSEFYKAMTSRGIDPSAAKQMAELGAPTYWGDQPIVGGPAYAGAALLFLFVLGLFVIQKPMRWWLLTAALLLVMLAWGKNLLFFNEFLFDHLPYLNKFRAMTMAFCLAQLFFAAGAALGLQTIIDQKMTLAQLRQPLLISLGLTAGVALVLAVLGGTLFSFQAPGDTDMLSRIFGEAGREFQSALISDRQSLLRSDAFRSVGLILLVTSALWLFLTNRIKAGVLYPIVVAVVVFDLFSVDKRFLNNADFVPKSVASVPFEITPADEQIAQDKSLGYRVFDQTGSFMETNRTSYFHRSIGGYNTTRLRRYNELINYAFQYNTLHILNMLHVKYVIQPGQPDPANPQQQPGAVAIPNPEVLGAAWFVGHVQQVAGADAELAAMKSLNPRDSAVVDKRFAAELGNLPSVMDHSGSTIQLTSYHPDKLIYQATAARDGLAVFSEIYYRGHEDWQAFIDGKPVPHLQANYVLRALRVPAGKHTVEFRFDPPLARTGDTIDLICNVLLICLIGFVIFIEGKNRRTQSAGVPEPIAPVMPAVTSTPVIESGRAKSGGAKSKGGKSR